MTIGIIKLFPHIKYKPNLNIKDFKKSVKEFDQIRIQTLLADYYQSIGTILFYKNKLFTELIDKAGPLLQMIKIDDQIKNISNSNHSNNYHPSVSSLIYFQIGLGQLFNTFKSDTLNLKNWKDYKKILDSGSFQLLSGKEKEFIAIIYAKLSDAILGSIDSAEFPINNISTDFKDFNTTVEFFSSK